MHLRWIARPVIFQLGGFALRWYAALFVTGMILGYRSAFKLVSAEGESFRLSPKQAESLFVYVFIGGLLGARLVHVLFYEPAFYFAEPSRILKIWEGGLASHGGALAILAGYIFCRRSKISFLWLADRVCPSIALLGGFVRLGNLFNSEILGKPATKPWAVIFSRVDEIPRHPVQLYEASFYFFSFFILKTIFKRTQLKERPGSVFGIFLIGIFTFRFFIEFLKENQVAAESASFINLGQALSVPFVLAGIYLVMARCSSPET